jgi:hypothetical protein
MFIAVPAQTVVGQFLSTFQEFPPSQKVGGITSALLFSTSLFHALER